MPSTTRQKQTANGNRRGTISIKMVTGFMAVAIILQGIHFLYMVSHSLPTPLIDTHIKLSSAEETKRPEKIQKRTIRHGTHGVPFAYFFIIAGCDPKKPSRYIGYVYNIIISKHVFMHSGSNADVVVLIRMASNTKEETIPEQKILQVAGIIVKYLPKVHTDNFFSAMLDKFQVLKYYSEYYRILFMDSDVTPFCNLDYMFAHSMGKKNAIFAPNVILSYKREPSQGGFFMLSPEEGDYERVQDIIDYRIRNFYNFSEDYGWGHKFSGYPDVWHSFNHENQTKWDFYGAYADQGLLLQWVKYEKSEVTIIEGNTLERWSEINPSDHSLIGPIEVTEVSGRSKTIGLIDKKTDIIKSCGGINNDLRRDYHVMIDAPYCDFHHFTGKHKPWLENQRPKNITQKLNAILNDRYRYSNIHSINVWWYYWLDKANKEMNLGVDVENFVAERPSLGTKIPKTYMYEYMDKQREIFQVVYPGQMDT